MFLPEIFIGDFKIYFWLTFSFNFLQFPQIYNITDEVNTIRIYNF